MCTITHHVPYEDILEQVDHSTEEVLAYLERNSMYWVEIYTTPYVSELGAVEFFRKFGND